MPSQLLDRLSRYYDQTPAVRVMAGRARWRVGSFGRLITDVRSIVTHVTAGWPRRDSANVFVQRYIVPSAPRRGLGTQFYISQDGTAARLIDLPLRTHHATFASGWSLGVETGNLVTIALPPGRHWIQASTDAEDIPGAKLWITSGRSVQTEVLPCWWTTTGYTGPGRGAIGAGQMIFSEWEHRTWSLLARYLCEEYSLPRNFPLLPHAQRQPVMLTSVPFRRIVVADERAEMMKRAFAAMARPISVSSFNPANAATLQSEYVATIAAAGGGFRRRNLAWLEFFDIYRGIHGHGFAGAIRSGDHDCPGSLFDFHRLAREVWDWWWYPFDVEGTSTAVPRREYRSFDQDTPLLEYYYDEDEAPRTARVVEGIHGSKSSPVTFALDASSPIYALSNGTLVAARFPDPGDGVSLAFVLVRHEVFHLPKTLLGSSPRARPGVLNPPTVAIDYDQAPSFVYTLYMHIGRPTGMSFEEVHDDNPDWLNRVLIRKKECDLGVAFYDDSPTHHGISQAVWNNRPPGAPTRSTVLEGWRVDQKLLTDFLSDFRAGRVAIQKKNRGAQPIQVLLGDFLGESGVIRRSGGTSTHGIRVETFSPSFASPAFDVAVTDGWDPPSSPSASPCLQYVSEWARITLPAEEDTLRGIGVDLAQLKWWKEVFYSTYLDIFLGEAAPTGAQVLDGNVYHYHPFHFMSWINDVTWENEWPKYNVLDGVGNPVPRPARPQTRRVV